MATGEAPGIILMIGARPAEPTFRYPRSALALRHGVGVEKETTSPVEAQSGFSEWQFERPTDWDALPWV